jgi:hypothetical protein
MPNGRERNRMLNDQLRSHHTGGKIYLTAAVRRLDSTTISKIDSALSSFAAFDELNDPYGEHDFAFFQVAGHDLIFKIDYYDLDYENLSPDPADEEQTRRVMTIMLAGEY